MPVALVELLEVAKGLQPVTGSPMLVVLLAWVLVEQRRIRRVLLDLDLRTKALERHAFGEPITGEHRIPQGGN